MKNEEIVDHPNYCPLFFKGLSLFTTEHSTTIGFGCCSQGNKCTNTNNVINDPWLNQQRNTWESQKLSVCKTQCWDVESVGNPSFRQSKVHWLKQLNNIDPTAVELLRLDYITEGTCNAKCITCSAEASSLWAEEDRKFGVVPLRPLHVDLQNSLVNLDVTKLCNLYLTGGEPLLSKHTFLLFEKIRKQADLSKLSLQISTNGSIIPSESTIKLWKECKDVELWVSIDAIETEFEYIRFPLQWQQVSSNLAKLSTISPNIHVKIAFTVGVHNINVLPNTYNWFVSKQKEWDMPDSAFGISPAWGTLNLNAASIGLKQHWKELLLSQNSHHFRNTAALIDEYNGADHKWMSYLAMIDQRRGLDWKKSLPLLYNAYKKSQPL